MILFLDIILSQYKQYLERTDNKEINIGCSLIPTELIQTQQKHFDKYSSKLADIIGFTGIALNMIHFVTKTFC